jgi:DNA-binding CsgD family transcriptional regulator
MGLSAAAASYRSIVLFRGADVPDFSERERVVLELLRPHFRAREARATLVALVAGRIEALDGGVDDLPLTLREREVVAMVSAGKTNAQIASSLWISPATVKKHLENTYLKLGVGNRAAAASRAQAAGADRTLT